MPVRRPSPALPRTLGNFFAGAREGQDIARRYERLSRMSDGQLASLGLSRDQVPRAAVKGF